MMAQNCYGHLATDTNRLWMSDCDLSLVINFDALTGK